MAVAQAAVPCPPSLLVLCLHLAFCVVVPVVVVVETTALLVELVFPAAVVVVMVLPVVAAAAWEVLLVADLLLQDLRLVADPLVLRRRS